MLLSVCERGETDTHEKRRPSGGTKRRTHTPERNGNDGKKHPVGRGSKSPVNSKEFDHYYVDGTVALSNIHVKTAVLP